jgi:uncharacterized protein (TIGR02001 family)
MKKMTKLVSGIALAVSALASTSAFAEVSYNVGFASEYYYRGLLQKSSSGSAGIDFEESGFYLGSWAADVGDGLEVDGYLGYGMETESGFSASIGATGYYYTGDFDDTYEEINLGAGYGPLSLEYSFGNYDNFGAGSQDYDFFAVTLEQAGFYGKYGTFGKDFDGDYFEVGYGMTVDMVDLGVSAIVSSKTLTGNSETDEALVFTIGYSW